jgi:uncharacterized membrane protein
MMSVLLMYGTIDKNVRIDELFTTFCLNSFSFNDYSTEFNMETVIPLVLVISALIAFFVTYLLKVSELSGKIRQLQWNLEALQKEIGRLKSGGVRSETVPQEVPPPAEMTPARNETNAAQPQATISREAEQIQFKTQFTDLSEPSRTKEEWEALIGGKLLNRIGALALIIGIGFFLKYAFDNNWISETVRVLIGTVIGILLIGGAVQTHKKGFQIFAQGLLGAGVAILYLSVYASFNYYHLVSQPVAFGLMSLVTITTFLLAIQYDSLAVSILGWAGGFLTPFMLSTGQANEIGLFTYIALLDAGILAIVLFKTRWIILEPLCLAGTYLIFSLWFNAYYQSSDIIPTSLFLTVFWLIFFGTEFWRNMQGEGSNYELRSVVAGVSGALYYGLLYWIIDAQYHHLMSGITFAIGIVYCGSAYIFKRTQPARSDIVPQYVLSAMLLLVIATAIQYSGLTAIMYWSVEGLALIICAVRWNLRYIWKSTLILYGLVLLRLLGTNGSIFYTPVLNFTLVTNERALAYSVFAISCMISAILFRDDDVKATLHVKSGFHYAWSFVLLILCLVETNDYFLRMKQIETAASFETLNFHQALAVSVAMMAYSLVLLRIGLLKMIVPLIHVGLGALAISLLAILAGGATYTPIGSYIIVYNLRAGIYFYIILGLVLHVLNLRRNPTGQIWLESALKGIEIAVFVTIFMLITVEVIDFFEKRIQAADLDSVIQRWMSFRQMSLSVAWLIYSVVLMVLGIWKRNRGIRIISIVLFGFTILKIFIYDLSFLETLYRIFSFIGLGIILLAVSYLYQRYKDVIVGGEKDS